MMIVSLLAGLVLLLAGGEGLVRGAVELARRAGVSPLFVGVVLLGFGTSAPELVACVQAVLAGAPGVALGNVLGSNTANILLILGVAALVMPVPATGNALTRDGTVMMVSALLLAGLAVFGRIGFGFGLLLVIGLLAYLAYAYWDEKQETVESEPPTLSLPVSLALAIGGLVGILIGGNLLVSGAITLAALAGVSDAVVGLTVVAVGTSLPELAAGVAATLRKQPELVIGNVLGSNVYNILGIMGTTAMVGPVPIPRDVLSFDVPVMLAATVAVLVLGFWKRSIGRVAGAVFLTAYVVYTVTLWV